jgi:hypothetical protein
VRATSIPAKARALLLAMSAAGAPALAADRMAAKAEVQINLCSPPGQIARALALQPEGTAPREAWYFETAGLDHHRRGAVFRLRSDGKRRELTLKVADQDCKRVAPGLLPPGEGKCEYDLHGADFKGAVSLSRNLDEAAFRGLLDGSVPLARALGPAQIRYLRDGLGAWPLAAGIERLGPVRIQPYRAKGQRFVVEAWLLPGGESFVEISEKTDHGAALRRREELLSILARAGVAVCEDQSSQALIKMRALARRPVAIPPQNSPSRSIAPTITLTNCATAGFRPPWSAFFVWVRADHTGLRPFIS